MAEFDKNDDSVVVVIGSGAGGGTVANELTQAGVNVVVLEAGRHLTNEDYVNNEWAAFNQMAWLDPRTTSGSFRLARDFPNLPAWIVKAVGGTTTHWSGATPRFKAHEFKARQYYGGIDGANLLDWPITLDDLAPYYDKAENNIGMHPSPRPTGVARQQQLQGVRERCRAGRLPLLRHRARTAPTPNPTTAGRPRSRTGSTSRATRTKSKWCTLVREIPRAAGHRQARPAARAATPCRSPTTRAAAPTPCSTSTRTGNLQRQRARSRVRGRQRDRDARGCCCCPAARCIPDGLANSSGQVGRNYMRHTTGSVYAQLRQAGAHVPRRDDGRDHRRRVAARPVPRVRRRLLHGDAVARGPPFLAAFVDPGAWGPGFTVDPGRRTRTPPGCGWSARTCRRRPTGSR